LTLRKATCRTGGSSCRGSLVMNLRLLNCGRDIVAQRRSLAHRLRNARLDHIAN
jgi:hypothetical protein